MNPQLDDLNRTSKKLSPSELYTAVESRKIFSAMQNALDSSKKNISKKDQKGIQKQLDSLLQDTIKGQNTQKGISDFTSQLKSVFGDRNKDLNQLLDYFKTKDELLLNNFMNDPKSTKSKDGQKNATEFLKNYATKYNKDLLKPLLAEVDTGNKSIQSVLEEMKSLLAQNNDVQKQQVQTLKETHKALTKKHPRSLTDRIRKRQSDDVQDEKMDELNKKLNAINFNEDVLKEFKGADTGEALGGAAVDSAFNLAKKTKLAQALKEKAGGLGIGGLIEGGVGGAIGAKLLGGVKNLGGLAGKGGKLLGKGLGKGSIGGLLGGVALDYASDYETKQGNAGTGAALDVGSDALTGAGLGATVGSIVPVIGTAIGGAVGGVAGAAYGAYKNKDVLGDKLSSWWNGDTKKDGTKTVSADGKQLNITNITNNYIGGEKLTKSQAAQKETQKKLKIKEGLIPGAKPKSKVPPIAPLTANTNKPEPGLLSKLTNFISNNTVTQHIEQAGSAAYKAVGDTIGVVSNYVAQKLSGSNKSIFREIYDKAKALGDPHPEVTAAQFSLESGFGKHMSGVNNPFGQKAKKNEPGSLVPTHEVYGGRSVKIHAKFKDYPTINDALKDHITRWTGKHTNNKMNTSQAIAAIQKAGYATDPRYGNKLMGIIAGAGVDIKASSGTQVATSSGGNSRGRAVNPTSPSSLPNNTNPQMLVIINLSQEQKVSLHK
jgi:flagellum-specific peptidoglycan hydrolase FlgJ